MLLAITFGFAGIANTAIFALLEEGLGRSPAFFSVIASIQGLGSIGGGITAAALIGRLIAAVMSVVTITCGVLARRPSGSPPTTLLFEPRPHPEAMRSRRPDLVGQEPSSVR